VTRAKRTDFFNYLLDLWRSDLLYFFRTLARLFFTRPSILIPPDTIAFISPSPHSPRTKNTRMFRIASPTTAFLFSFSSVSLPSIMFSYASNPLFNVNGFYVDHMRRCTHVVRCLFLRYPSWVDRYDPLECRRVIFADLLLVYFMHRVCLSKAPDRPSS